MTDYTKLVEALRWCADESICCDDFNGEKCSYYDVRDSCSIDDVLHDAAAAIEALQAEVKRLQDKLCDWCAVCPKERRRPEDCELLSETPVMYGPSDAAKMEVQK